MPDPLTLGRLAITYEALAGILRLPEGATITAIVPPTAEDIAERKFSIIVQGPGLPRHSEGASITKVGMTCESAGRTFFTW